MSPNKFKILLFSALALLLAGCVAQSGVNNPLDASTTGLVNQGSLSASLGSDLAATLQSNGVSTTQTSTIVNTAMSLSNSLSQAVQSQLYQASLLAKQQDPQAQPISAAQAEQLSVAEISAEFVKGALQGIKKAGTLEINGLAASAAKAKVTGLSAGSPLKTIVQNNLVASATDKETAFKAISSSAVSNLGEAGFTSVTEISAVIVNISEQSVTAVASAGSGSSEAGDAARHLVTGVISGLKNINNGQVTDFDASKLAQLTSSATSGSVKGLNAFSGLNTEESKTAIKAVTSASMDAVQVAVIDFKAKVESGQQTGTVDSSLLTNMIKEAANGISANVSTLDAAKSDTITSLLSEVSTAVNENMDELTSVSQSQGLSGTIDKNVLADDVIKGMTVAIADYGVSSADLLTEVSNDFTGDVTVSVDTTALDNAASDANNSFGHFKLLGADWPCDVKGCTDTNGSQNVAIFNAKKKHILVIEDPGSLTIHFPGSDIYAQHAIDAAMLYASDPVSCSATNLAIVRYYSKQLDSYGFAVIKASKPVDQMANGETVILASFSPPPAGIDAGGDSTGLYAASALPTDGFLEYVPNEAAPLVDDYGRIHQPQVSFSASQEGRYENGETLNLPIYSGSTSSDANKESVASQPPVTLAKPYQITDDKGYLLGLEITGSFWFDPNKDTPFTGKDSLLYFLYSPGQQLTTCTPGPEVKDPGTRVDIHDFIDLQPGAESDIFFKIEPKPYSLYGTGNYILCLSGPIADVSGQVYVDNGTIISGEPFFVQIPVED